LAESRSQWADDGWADKTDPVCAAFANGDDIRAAIDEMQQ
jgi:hypothetical protein